MEKNVVCHAGSQWMSCCFYFTCIWETHIQKHLSLPTDMNNEVEWPKLSLKSVLRNRIIQVGFHLTCYFSYSPSIGKQNLLKPPMKIGRLMPGYPAAAQQDAWCSRVALHDAEDLFQLLLLPCSNIIAGYPEHKSWLFGEGALSEISHSKVIPP